MTEPQLPKLYLWRIRQHLVYLLGIGKPAQITRCHRGYEDRYRALNKAAAEGHAFRKKRTIVLTALVMLAFLLWLIYLTGCDTYRGVYPEFEEELPVVNVSNGMRQFNYTKGGSCVHASLITLLRWQNRSDEARAWRETYSGGEWATRLSEKLDSQGIRYAYTSSGDVKFLEWACRTRRGCGVAIRGGSHMVTLVHLDESWAAILDNNDISRFVWLPRENFIEDWQSSGWAVTPVYSPSAPLPH